MAMPASAADSAYATVFQSSFSRVASLRTAYRLQPWFLVSGALLCLADNGDNPETTLRALEVMMKELTEASDAGTEDTQPSA